MTKNTMGVRLAGSGELVGFCDVPWEPWENGTRRYLELRRDLGFDRFGHRVYHDRFIYVGRFQVRCWSPSARGGTSYTHPFCLKVTTDEDVRWLRQFPGFREVSRARVDRWLRGDRQMGQFQP